MVLTATERPPVLRSIEPGEKNTQPYLLLLQAMFQVLTCKTQENWELRFPHSAWLSSLQMRCSQCALVSWHTSVPPTPEMTLCLPTSCPAVSICSVFCFTFRAFCVALCFFCRLFSLSCLCTQSCLLPPHLFCVFI